MSGLDYKKLAAAIVSHHEMVRPRGHVGGPLKPVKVKLPGVKKQKAQALTRDHPISRKIHAIAKSIGVQLALAKSKAAASGALLSGSAAKPTGGPLMIVKVDQKGVPSLVEMSASDSKEQDSRAVSAAGVVARPFGSEREFSRTILGSKPVKACLLLSGSGSSSANAAYTGVVNADLATTTQFAQWGALFDEVRCVGSFLRFTLVAVGAAATLPTPADRVWCVAWDPSDNAPFASQEDACYQTRHIGPVPMSFSNGVSVGSGQVLSCALPVTKYGHFELKALPPLKGQLPVDGGSTLSDRPVGADWCPCTSPNIIMGYYKFYVPALGASINSFLTYFMFMEAEFKFQG